MTDGGIVFLGASALGARCCEALVDDGLPLALIVSIPREFTISWSATPVVNAQFEDLGVLARARGIPFTRVRSGRPEDYDAALGASRPDLIVVIGWYYMVPSSIRARARLGAVGLHASLLPRYRGGAPLVWAMINGERETGVTLFHLGAGVDDGDTIAQKRFAISETDDIASVLEKATRHSVDLVRQQVPRVIDGSASRTPQDERASTIMPQRTPADGLIHWDSFSRVQALDWIRAQTHPYSGAYTLIDGERITVWAARPAASGFARPPGTIDVGASVTVWCSDGEAVEITELSVADGPRVPARVAIERGVLLTGARVSEKSG